MDERTTKISAGRLRTLARDLIQRESTMTLATAKGDTAWAAPVYYVFFRSCFCFFSDPESRHIRESVAGCRASAAIHASGSSWEDIRGIQMSGTVEMVSGKLEALEIISSYLKKYGFTRKFFSGNQALDVDAFADRFNVRLYRFRPTLLYYLDNSLGFGFREAVDL